MEGGERFRRLLLAREKLLSEASELRAHGWIDGRTTTAALSLVTTVFGVPLGAKNAIQFKT